MKKISFLILLFFTILNISQVNNAGAFLDSDLGLDLYKNLDEGLEKFEETQYIYELSGQEKDDIAEKINSLLKNKNISDCFESGVNARVIDSIANGDIKVLMGNLKKEEKCGYNEKKGKFDSISSKQVGEFIIEISNIRAVTKNKAEEKAKAIYEISRIGMYSDGSIDNSPFDIINDIQDIDKIIFTDEIEYDGDENSFLNDLAKNKLSSPIYSSPTNLISKDKDSKNKNNILNTGNLGDKDTDDENSLSDYLDLGPNKYVCSDTVNESGLSDDSLNALKDSLNGNSNENISFSFNYSSGYIKLPESNKIDIPDLNSNNYFSLNASPYSSVNDNSKWGCNSFFCIVIDFVINNHNALGYSSSKSIENIIKTSNKHLKKAANTSLVQSKMATNNFEMSLRDLDLPSIFHMGFVITKKSPPILNLDNITGNKTENNSPKNEKIKILLREKYKNLDLDYDKSNNINKYLHTEEQLLGIIHSLENSSVLAENRVNEYAKMIKLQSQVNDYDKSNKTSEINNDILKDFDLEFSELEQFTSNMLDYANNLDILIKNLNKIPTHSG